MNLKALIKKDFGVDLPIRGGTGNSINNPIIIERTANNDYVNIEYKILKCIGLGRRIQWKSLGQQLIIEKARKIDKIKIETIMTTDEEIITQIENYYFDITECFGYLGNNKDLFDEEDLLIKITNRIEELRNINEFNSMCISLLKKGILFDNTDLTIEFLDVILKDKSLPLFECLMDNRSKPVMTVLSIIAPRLK